MMKLTKIALATLATLAAGSSFAGPIPTDGLWRGNLGGSLSLTSGNSKSTNLVVGTDAVSADAMGKTTLYLNALRASAESKDASGVTTNNTTANTLRGGGRYEYNLSPQTYGFGSLDLERDPIQELKLRSALGAGLGYHVLNTADTLFDVFGGVGYNIERFEAGNRNSTELILGEESVHKLSDSSSFKQRLALYPNLKDSGEYRAVFDAGFTTAIAGGWNLNVGLSDRYNSVVGKPDAKKNDLLFTTGVSTKFGAPVK
jgi:putative salt-induced outer membrane protein YdiY